MKIPQNRPKIGVKRAYEFTQQVVETPVVNETTTSNLYPLFLESNNTNTAIPWPPALM